MPTRCVIFVLFLLTAASDDAQKCGRRQTTIDDRVIGGNLSKIVDYPWLAFVVLQRPNTGYPEVCTATVISKRFLLTAGHCCVAEDSKTPLDPSAFNVYVGAEDFNSSDIQKFEVQKVNLHPKFIISEEQLPDSNHSIMTQLQNDVAILELKEPLVFSDTVHPICLPFEFHEHECDSAIIAGWGQHAGDVVTDGKLREAMLLFRRFDLCNQSIMNENKDIIMPFAHYEEFICAGGEGTGAGHGDSGGPLLYERNGVWYQVGVTCWVNDAHETEQDEYPGMYSRVTSYCDWIEAETGKEATCVEAVLDDDIY